MAQPKKEASLKFRKFCASTLGRYLHEASVLILVFGGLDEVENKLHFSTWAMTKTAVFAIVLFLVSGTLEWIGKTTK